MGVIESWIVAGIGSLVGKEEWKLRLYVQEGSQTCGSWVTCSLPVSLLWSFHQSIPIIQCAPAQCYDIFI